MILDWIDMNLATVTRVKMGFHHIRRVRVFIFPVRRSRNSVKSPLRHYFAHMEHCYIIKKKVRFTVLVFLSQVYAQPYYLKPCLIHYLYIIYYYYIREWASSVHIYE